MFGQGQGHDGRVQFALAQHFQQLDGEIFLQDQGHLGHVGDHGLDQRRQQIRADGVDHAQPQGAGQRVLVLLGQFLDGGRLFQHAFGLGHDLGPQRGDGDFRAAPFKQYDTQLVFELLDCYRERWLGDVARLGRVAEVFRSCNSNDIFQFGQCHKPI